MKKAFTMIELIFVILILGVLAAVALPKLATTRDDAEVVKAASDLTTAISDISTYYTAKGKFATNIHDMTRAIAALNANNGVLKIKGADCAQIRVISAGDATDTTIPARASKIIIDFSQTANKDDAACLMLRKFPSIKNMCAKGDDEIIDECEIIVSGFDTNW